jgi:DNA mismatch endonuclease (patch repair protein)
MPKSRRAFWKKKIEGNIERDAANEMKLRRLGWHVVTVWECGLKSASCGETLCEQHLKKFLAL